MNYARGAESDVTTTHAKYLARLVPDRRQSQRGSSENQLLALLPSADRQRLAEVLEFTTLARGQMLLKEGQPVENVYFLNGGVCALSKKMAGGGSMELVAVGREGFLGVDAVLGSRVSACDVSVRIPGDSAYALSVEAFREEMTRGGAFYETMSQYAGGFVRLLMQSSACAALHRVKQRSARWLLVMRDQLERDEISVNHNTLALALGVRRPTVTLVLNDLVRTGVILLRRSRILIVDAAALESAACECCRTRPSPPPTRMTSRPDGSCAAQR